MCRYHVDFVIDFASAAYEITEWKTFEHGRLHTSSPAVFIADEYVCFYQVNIFFNFDVSESYDSAYNNGNGKQMPVFEIFFDQTRKVDIYQCAVFIEIFHAYILAYYAVIT